MLHRGPMSIEAMTRATEMAGAGAVMDTDAARMAGVDFAIGPRALLDDLKARLAAGARAQIATAYPDLPEDAANWLATGERGLSSEAIFSKMTGINLDRNGTEAPHVGRSHPCDPADLRRCRLLLEAVPAFAARLEEMSEVSRPWTRLVAVWEVLCAGMDREIPDWRTGGGSAPETLARMRAAIEGDTAA